MKIKELKNFFKFVPDEVLLFLQSDRMYSLHNDDFIETYTSLSCYQLVNLNYYCCDTVGEVYVLNDQKEENPEKTLNALSISHYGLNENLSDSTASSFEQMLNYYNEELDIFISDLGEEGYYRAISSFDYFNVELHSGDSSGKIYRKIKPDHSLLEDMPIALALSWRPWKPETLSLLKTLALKN